MTGVICPYSSVYADDAFNIYRATMHDFVASAFGWDDTIQREGFLKTASPKTCMLCLIGGECAGFILWKKMPEHIHLQLLCVDQQHQSSGYGSMLLGALREVMQNEKLPLLGTILPGNPSWPFYERQGFEATASENGISIRLTNKG